MTRSSEAHNWNDLIAGYALGNLTLAEVEALKQKLSDNPQLQEELALYEDLLTVLPQISDGPAPAPQLKSKILEAALESTPVAETPPAAIITASPTSQPQSSSRPTRRWQWIAAVGIGAIAVGGLIVQNLSLRQQVNTYAALDQKLDQAEQDIQRLQSQLESYDAVVASLQQPGVATFSLSSVEGNPSSGTLLSIPGHSKLVLVTRQLPELPESQIYRFWALAKGATKPTYCGQFRHDLTGTARWQSPNEICSQNPVQVMVTLDAPNDPISSAGPVVLEGHI